MPIIKMGESLPSLYLQNFKPEVNVTKRIAILATDVLAIESHWLDVPALGIKGSYTCVGGTCCSINRKWQQYCIPVFEFSNENGQGEFKVWRMTSTTYAQVTALAKNFDITKCDIQVTAFQQGNGTRSAVSFCPEGTYRANWTPDIISLINQSVEHFYREGEHMLVNPMSENEYQQILQAILSSGGSVTGDSYSVGVQAIGQSKPQGYIQAPTVQASPVVPTVPTVGVVNRPESTPVSQFSGNTYTGAVFGGQATHMAQPATPAQPVTSVSPMGQNPNVGSHSGFSGMSGMPGVSQNIPNNVAEPVVLTQDDINSLLTT